MFGFSFWKEWRSLRASQKDWEREYFKSGRLSTTHQSFKDVLATCDGNRIVEEITLRYRERMHGLWLAKHANLEPVFDDAWQNLMLYIVKVPDIFTQATEVQFRTRLIHLLYLKCLDIFRRDHAKRLEFREDLDEELAAEDRADFSFDSFLGDAAFELIGMKRFPVEAVQIYHLRDNDRKVARLLVNEVHEGEIAFICTMTSSEVSHSKTRLGNYLTGRANTLKCQFHNLMPRPSAKLSA